MSGPLGSLPSTTQRFAAESPPLVFQTALLSKLPDERAENSNSPLRVVARESCGSPIASTSGQRSNLANLATCQLFRNGSLEESAFIVLLDKVHHLLWSIRRKIT